MAANDFKYRFRFDFPNSNYQAELVMIPCGLTAIADNYIDCDEAMLNEVKLSWEFDKYPIGILNPTIDITFNLTNLSSDLQYLLINPYSDITYKTSQEVSWESSTGLSLESNQINYGNYYELSIKHVDDVSYTLVFQGVTSDVDSSGITDNTRKVTIESLGKTILSNINIDWASRVWINSGGVSQTDIDYYSYTSGGNSQRIRFRAFNYANLSTPFKLWTYTLNQITAHWQAIADTICLFITRQTRATYNIDVFSKFGASIYKNGLSENATTIGTVLSTNTIKVPTHIASADIASITWTQAILDSVIDNTQGGLFYLMKNSEYNTLWDFASAFCQSSLFKYNNFTSIAPYTIATNSTLDIEQISYNMDASANYEVLKEVSSQYLEESGQNAKEFKQTNTANKTDNSYTLEHVFSTKIYVPDEKTITATPSPRQSISSQLSNGILFYTQASTDYKVHENYNPDLGNSKDLNDYASINAYTLPSQVNELNLAGYQAIETGLSNNASLTAKCLLELYKSKTQSQLKFDILFDDTVISGVNSIIFQPNLRDIYFDMTTFNTHYSTYSNNHSLTKCEFDLLSGIASFETISRSW